MPQVPLQQISVNADYVDRKVIVVQNALENLNLIIRYTI